MTDSAPAPDRITELESKLTEAETSLTQAREALDASERRRGIDRELLREGAIDVETAALLTETAIAGMDKADVVSAIADLKRSKPFLFRPPPPPPKSGAMAGVPADPPSSIDDAAALARETGDRNILLRYLRLKRSA